MDVVEGGHRDLCGEDRWGCMLSMEGRNERMGGRLDRWDKVGLGFADYTRLVCVPNRMILDS